MQGLIYWMIITLIYIIVAGVIHNKHLKFEISQQHKIEVLKYAIGVLGGKVTEEEDQLTIEYNGRGEDE